MTATGRWSRTRRRQTERPPLPVGNPLYVYDGPETTRQDIAKQVIFGNRYTNPDRGYQITKIRVWTVIGNEYVVYGVSDPTGIPIFNEIAAFTADTDGWSEINYNPSLIIPGTTFDIIVGVQEPDPTPTTFVGNWDYDTPNNPGVPAAGVILHANQATSLLRVHKTDDDGADRSADLATLDVGDIIDSGNLRWAIQSIADNGTYYEYGIAPAQQDAPDGVRAFTFETVTATPITHLEAVDFWLTSAYTVQGIIGIDVPYSSATINDSAYGVDIFIQEVQSSEDWDFLANSGGSAGGGGGDFQPTIFAGPGTVGYVPDPVSGGREFLDADANWGPIDYGDLVGTPPVGATLWTTSGDDILNTNAGSVVVGPIVNTPSRAFEVHGVGGSGSTLDRPTIKLVNGLADDFASNIEFFNDATRIGYLSMLAQDSLTDPKFVMMNSDAQGTLEFGTANTTRMLVDADGNVGIGTTAPDARLHVVPEVQNGEIARFGWVAGRQLRLSEYVSGGANSAGFDWNAPQDGGSHQWSINGSIKADLYERGGNNNGMFRSDKFGIRTDGSYEVFGARTSGVANGNWWEFATIVPGGNSRNYRVWGEVNLQNGTIKSSVGFDVSLRSNTLPDLSSGVLRTFRVPSSDEAVSREYPAYQIVLWSDEVAGVWRFLVRNTGGLTVQNTNAVVHVQARGNYPEDAFRQSTTYSAIEPNHTEKEPTHCFTRYVDGRFEMEAARVTNLETGGQGVKMVTTNNNGDLAFQDIPAGGGGDAFWSGTLGGDIQNANAGNVGIGTSPSERLHVLEDTSGVAIVKIENPTNNSRLLFNCPNVASINIADELNSLQAQIRYSVADGDMSFLVGGDIGTTTRAMTILNNQNVGVGTETPGRKFVVDNATQQVIANFASTNANPAGISVSNAGTTGDNQVRLQASSNSLQLVAGGAANFTLFSSGQALFNDLAGSGERLVTADASGILSADSTTTIDSDIVFNGAIIFNDDISGNTFESRDDRANFRFYQDTGTANKRAWELVAEDVGGVNKLNLFATNDTYGYTNPGSSGGFFRFNRADSSTTGGIASFEARDGAVIIGTVTNEIISNLDNTERDAFIDMLETQGVITNARAIQLKADLLAVFTQINTVTP